MWPPTLGHIKPNLSRAEMSFPSTHGLKGVMPMGFEKLLTHPTKRSGHRHAREPHDLRRFVSDEDGYNVESDGDDARWSRGPQ